MPGEVKKPKNNKFQRALLAFGVLPGMAAGVVPLLLSFWDPYSGDGHFFGFVVSGMEIFILLWCVRDFYTAGQGTLAPWDPPTKLVFIELYRYVRKPMYIRVLFILAGWIIITASPLIFIFTLILWFAFHIRVIASEEPWAEKTFGPEWLNYKNNVNRWLPRLKSYFAG